MPWCPEISLQDNFHILVYVWCSSFVQYLGLVKFLHFTMYPFWMTSTDPGKALFNILCRNDYSEIFTGKDDMVAVFFSVVSQVTSQVDLLISKEASSQNKAFCTSPQWNIYLFFSFFFVSPCCFCCFHSFALIWYYLWTWSCILYTGFKVRCL